MIARKVLTFYFLSLDSELILEARFSETDFKRAFWFGFWMIVSFQREESFFSYFIFNSQLICEWVNLNLEVFFSFLMQTFSSAWFFRPRIDDIRTLQLQQPWDKKVWLPHPNVLCSLPNHFWGSIRRPLLAYRFVCLRAICFPKILFWWNPTLSWLWWYSSHYKRVTSEKKLLARGSLGCISGSWCIALTWIHRQYKPKNLFTRYRNHRIWISKRDCLKRCALAKSCAFLYPTILFPAKPIKQLMVSSSFCLWECLIIRYATIFLFQSANRPKFPQAAPHQVLSDQAQQATNSLPKSKQALNTSNWLKVCFL